MNILTDILSLFKRKKVTNVVNPNDVVIVAKNEEPDMEGIASPVPYKNIELVRVGDLIQSQDLDFKNVPLLDPSPGCFKDTTTDPVTGQTTVNFRRFKSLSLNLTIDENGDFIEFDNLAETNTASNVGSGAEVFKQKVGEDLEFRTLTSTDNSLNIQQNSNEIDISLNQSIVTLTNPGSGPIPVNFINANILQITLSASAVYNFPLPLNMNVGSTYMIIVIQEGVTGGATATFSSDYMWPGGTQPTLTATPGAVDILSFVCISDPSTGLPALAGVPTLNLQ